MAYHHYFRTGYQDCNNVISIDDFADEIRSAVATDPNRPIDDLAVEIVTRVWASWDSDPDFRAQWLEQDAEDCAAEGLDPSLCYLEWSAGWRACARSCVARWITERLANQEGE